MKFMVITITLKISGMSEKYLLTSYFSKIFAPFDPPTRPILRPLDHTFLTSPLLILNPKIFLNNSPDTVQTNKQIIKTLNSLTKKTKLFSNNMCIYPTWFGIYKTKTRTNKNKNIYQVKQLNWNSLCRFLFLYAFQ